MPGELSILNVRQVQDDTSFGTISGEELPKFGAVGAELPPSPLALLCRVGGSDGHLMGADVLADGFNVVFWLPSGDDFPAVQPRGELSEHAHHVIYVL